MKEILTALFFLSSTTAFTQSDHNRNRNDVPPEVQRSFEKDYPEAKDTRWDNNNGKWHGVYKDRNNRDAETYYDDKGQKIDTHISYNRDELPQKVRDKADKKYHSDYRSYRVERPNSQSLFQIKLQDGTSTYYDEHGRKRKYKDGH